MATTERATAVADAGPLIHLDQLESLNRLDDFQAIHVPAIVWTEVKRHRPDVDTSVIHGFRLESSDPSPSASLSVLAESIGLDAGETSALGLMQRLSVPLLLCDDAAARLLAESMGYRVHGTIGILVRAIRRGQRTKRQVLETLRSISQRSTLFIRPSLLDQICSQVEQHQ